MEVYAVTREFQEWGKGLYKRLPTPIRNGLKAAGVCHYMVVVREGPEGDLYSFDFGPVGGDVTGALSGGVAGFPQSQLCFDDVVPGSLPMRRSQSTPALFKEAPEEEDASSKTDDDDDDDDDADFEVRAEDFVNPHEGVPFDEDDDDDEWNDAGEGYSSERPWDANRRFWV